MEIKELKEIGIEIRDRVNEYIKDNPDEYAREVEFEPRFVGNENDADFLLVYDPIDGSTNAACGIPFYCTSLAYTEKIESAHLNDISMGVVCSLQGSTYHAERGGGAFLNDIEIPKIASITRTKSEKIEEKGQKLSVFSYGVEKVPNGLIELLKTKKARTLGSIALEMCFVADGTLDGVIDTRGRLSGYDIAASALILKEAGGFLTDLWGTNLSDNLEAHDLSIVGTKNQMFLDEIVEMIKPRILNEFLFYNKTNEKLSELILFLSEQANKIKEGFFQTQKAENTKNIYGEEQMTLDKLADDVFVNGLKKSRLVRYISTEEQPDIIKVLNHKNEFGVVLDPLDGSSLIDVNLTIGTIIGIYPGNVLETGANLIAAMYILYGPVTTLTFTTGNGVHEFVMDKKGVFNLREKYIKIPDGKIYAPGALQIDYLPKHARFIETLEKEGYKLRYSGSFVADVHQILHKGGVFTYPGFKGKEKGKLRLLFEANPIGKIITEAGGAISNGKIDILSIKPEAFDELTPIYVGGKKEISLIEKLMSGDVN